MNQQHKVFLVNDYDRLLKEFQVHNTEEYCENHWPSDYPIKWKPPKGSERKRFSDWRKITKEPEKNRRNVYGTVCVLPK